MTFNSLAYLFFLPFVSLIYFLLGDKWRTWWLLVCSYGFYMYWRWEYGALMLFSTFVTFVAALGIQQSDTQHAKRWWLVLGLVTDLGLLLFFKYAYFLSVNIQQLGSFFGWAIPVFHHSFLLPVGISFYTFQSIGYTIDVYKQRIPAEPNFKNYALFISFFPQLVAGPIEAAAHLLPQLKRTHKFDWQRFISGGQLIVWGLFKKIVIADNIADYVNAVFNNLHQHSGFTLILAMYLFVYQVYCDFSGYSDIAVGSARILGVNLMLNFNRPFLSRSYAQLWQRWHISLTHWMRQYVYIPLGGNRTNRWQWYANILLVYFLVGLWHGAAWTFIGFGLLHGITIVLALITQPLRQQWVRAIGLHKYPQIDTAIDQFFTLSLFAFNCIIFRCTSLTDWWYIITHAFNTTTKLSNMPLVPLTLIAPMLLLFLWIQSFQPVGSYSPFEQLQKYAWRWAIYLVLVFAILLFGNQMSNTFFYFQF